MGTPPADDDAPVLNLDQVKRIRKLLGEESTTLMNVRRPGSPEAVAEMIHAAHARAGVDVAYEARGSQAAPQSPTAGGVEGFGAAAGGAAQEEAEEAGGEEEEEPVDEEGYPASRAPQLNQAEEEPTAITVGAAIGACARSDRPDRLITTLVCDEGGVALGIVYSSKESIEEAVRTRRGVFYSRSRRGLWRKGETSGLWQELLSVKLDCDADALRFTVHQHGVPAVFCHRETRTCWGSDGGLRRLERTLARRKQSAPAGSYTKRLLEDPELLRHRMLEEVQELSEAEGKAAVTAKAADIMYFAMVRCAAQGISLADIDAELDQRALRVRRQKPSAAGGGGSGR